MTREEKDRLKQNLGVLIPSTNYCLAVIAPSIQPVVCSWGFTCIHTREGSPTIAPFVSRSSRVFENCWSENQEEEGDEPQLDLLCFPKQEQEEPDHDTLYIPKQEQDNISKPGARSVTTNQKGKQDKDPICSTNQIEKQNKDSVHSINQTGKQDKDPVCLSNHEIGQPKPDPKSSPSKNSDSPHQVQPVIMDLENPLKHTDSTNPMTYFSIKVYRCRESSFYSYSEPALVAHTCKENNKKVIVRYWSEKKEGEIKPEPDPVTSPDRENINTNNRRVLVSSLPSDKKKIVCPICPFRTYHKSDLEVHMHSHIGEKPFTCHPCPQKYTCSNNHKQHLSIHTGERPYACPICSRRFIQKCHLKSHMRIHPEFQPDYQLTTKRKRNQRNYNSVKWSIEEKKTILHCFTYSRFEKWGKKKNLLFQERISNSALPSAKKKATTINKLNSIASQMHKYLTPEEIQEIQKEALEEAEVDYRSEEEIRKREKPYVIVSCWSEKREGENRPEPDPVTSQVLPTTCPNNHSLIDLPASDRKKMTCPICHVKTYHKSGLEIHMRSHTGEKPFSCPYCPKKFTRSNDRKQHIRIHTGEKPFACPVCSKRFIQKSNMKTHMKCNHPSAFGSPGMSP
ncbi:hypothetical protein Pmani_017851 [Petrolisthes manimaculis]|uniref:C2H2-type domain-containing protein n=1 Tax=Petrolisthes manimaculis TaxID=1843537 RepID=A0AAE1U7B9_9EUCA|nr:hypothetical protein Pmani_017851 [Petrolisthes manimaculis]